MDTIHMSVADVIALVTLLVALVATVAAIAVITSAVIRRTLLTILLILVVCAAFLLHVALSKRGTSRNDSEARQGNSYPRSAPQPAQLPPAHPKQRAAEPAQFVEQKKHSGDEGRRPATDKPSTSMPESFVRPEVTRNETKADRSGSTLVANTVAKTSERPIAAPTDQPVTSTSTSIRKPLHAGSIVTSTAPPGSDESPLRDAEIVTIANTGFIAGLEGRLNPIKDSLKRTYLYADNIAIEGGKTQPVAFVLGRPFVVEDATGHRFTLRIVSITNRWSVIEYRREPSSSEHRRDLEILVADQNANPIIRAHVLALFPDGTYLEGFSDRKGALQFTSPKAPTVTIYCAHESFSALVTEVHAATAAVRLAMASEGKGSIIVNGTGYIPGLDGRLDPILDSGNRRYLYADNIAIGDERPQPADFQLHVPFQLRDKNGATFQIEVVAMMARSSLIEFSKSPDLHGP